MQIHPHSPRMMQNLHQLFTHLHYVSDAGLGRELSEIPANQAKFTPFAHKLCELREFCTKIHPHLFTIFRTINRELQEIGANQPDFAQFTHSSHELCEIH